MRHFMIRFPGGKCKAFTTSYDDGVDEDIKLISIMRKNGIRGTFNLNGGLFAPEGTVYPAGDVHRRQTLEQSKKTYAGSDIEVAIHGLHHPFLETLPLSECTREILSDRDTLESAFGGIIRGMAYPYGTYNDEVVGCLKACGIVYARTVVSTHRFDIPTDWLRMPATCHHNDPELMKLGDDFIKYREDRASQLFYLWGHSYEFEERNNWNLIEDFLGKLGHRENIWYATNIEIYNYVQAYKSLIVSADAKRVYNPTCTQIWFTADNNNYMIGPGETMEL